MSDCQHPALHLRKRCTGCGTSTAKLHSKFCSVCRECETFEYYCGLCTGITVAHCPHSVANWQKRCSDKQCSDVAETLNSKFCSECGKHGPFEVFCNICTSSNSSATSSLTQLVPPPSLPPGLASETDVRVSHPELLQQEVASVQSSTPGTATPPPSNPRAQSNSEVPSNVDNQHQHFESPSCEIQDLLAQMAPSPLGQHQQPSGQMTAGPLDQNQQLGGQMTAGPSEQNQQLGGQMTAGPSEQNQQLGGQMTAGPSEQNQHLGGQMTAGPLEQNQHLGGQMTAGPSEQNLHLGGQTTNVGPNQLQELDAQMAPSTSAAELASDVQRKRQCAVVDKNADSSDSTASASVVSASIDSSSSVNKRQRLSESSTNVSDAGDFSSNSNSKNNCDDRAGGSTRLQPAASESATMAPGGAGDSEPGAVAPSSEALQPSGLADVADPSTVGLQSSPSTDRTNSSSRNENQIDSVEPMDTDDAIIGKAAGSSSSGYPSEVVQNLGARLGNLNVADAAVDNSPRSPSKEQTSSVQTESDGRTRNTADYSRIVAEAFPNESLVEVRFCFFIEREAFKFNPDRDQVLLVVKNEKICSGQTHKSPFIIGSENVKDFRFEKMPALKLSRVAVSFLLPHCLLKSGFDYWYAVKTNSMWQDSQLLTMRLTGLESQPHLLFDGLVRPVSNQSTTYNTRSSDTNYASCELQHCLFVESLIAELAEHKTAQMCSNVLKIASHQLDSIKIDQYDHRTKELKPKALKQLLERLIDAPSNFGFSDAAGKTWEQWLASVRLFLFAVRNRMLPFQKHCAFQLKKDHAKGLLGLVLPPTRQNSEGLPTFDGKLSAEFLDAMLLISEGEAFEYMAELLYLAPAYHLIVLGIQPFDADAVHTLFGRRHNAHDPTWWGVGRIPNKFFDQMKRVKLDSLVFEWLDGFLASYGYLDPLLDRFCCAIMNEANLPDMLKLNSVACEVKLALCNYFLACTSTDLWRHYGDILNFLEKTAVQELRPMSLSLSLFISADLCELTLQKTYLFSRNREMANRLRFQLVNFVLMCFLEFNRKIQAAASSAGSVDCLSEEEAALAWRSVAPLLNTLASQDKFFANQSVHSLSLSVQCFNQFYETIKSYEDVTEPEVSKICSASLREMLDFVSKDSMMELFNTGNLVSMLEVTMTGIVLEILMEKLEGGSHKGAFSENLSKAWKEIRCFFDSKHRYSKKVSEVMSKMIVTMNEKFQRSEAPPGIETALVFVLEWPIAMHLISELNREGLSDRFSPEALRILKHCSSVGSQFLKQNSSVDFVSYGHVEYLSKHQDALETLSRAVGAKLNVGGIVEAAVAMKQRVDATLEVLRNLLNFLQNLSNAEMVDLDEFRNSISTGHLNAITLGFLVDRSLPPEALQLKGFSVLKNFSNEIYQLLGSFDRLLRSKTFEKRLQRALKMQFKNNNERRLKMESLIPCIIAAREDWETRVQSLMSEQCTLSTVTQFLGELINDPKELNGEFRCFQSGYDEKAWMEYARKVFFALRMSRYSKTASAIIKVLEKFSVTSELDILKKALRMGERSMETPLLSVEAAHIDQFDYLEEVSKEEHFVPLMNAIEQSFEFCKWVRENVQEQDLKTFFDLAMIYLGDSGDLEQKKIETFNHVVTEFAEIIYKLGEVSNQRGNIASFLQQCGTILAKVKANPQLIKDLNETSSRLDWIKAVKENQGSVEKTTIKKIEAIVRTGFIYIGCLVNEDEPFLLKATYNNESEAAQAEVIECSLDDIRDLQSKLMLIAGQSYENRDLLERFVCLTTSIFRLIDVYKEFKLHCCVLCERVVMKFNLKSGRKNNVSIELRYCNPAKIIKYSYENIATGLAALSNVFQDCLIEWKEVVQNVRTTHHSLNFFNLKQLRLLQTELAPLFCTADATDQVSELLLHLLGYLSPNCTVEDINRSVDEVVVERAQGSRAQAQRDDTHSVVTEHLRDEGFSEDIIKQTVRILFRNTDLEDLPTVEELQEQATDLAYKIEKNAVTQADKQPRKEWKTADQELIAAEVGNLPAHDAFRRLWQIYLRNIDTSHKDFLCFKDVALFLTHLGRQRSSPRSQRRLQRAFAKSFPPGKPIALTLEPKEQLLVTLHLFQQAYNALPQFEEVLICNEETSEEEVSVFLHRSILDRNPESVYVIMNADQLTYDLSVSAEEHFSKLLDRVNGKTESYLFALSSSESQKQYPFCNALSLFLKELPTKPSLKGIIDWVSKFMKNESGPAQSSFLWITSDRSGMGKSLLCSEIAKTRHGKPPRVFSCSDLHLEVDKLYAFFDNIDSAKDKSRGPKVFHLDIAREVQSGFEHVFTQLALLGAITDSSGQVWRRRREDLYLLEHSRNFLFKTEFFVLQYLPSITCVSPMEAMRQLEDGEMGTAWKPLLNETCLQSPIYKRPAVYLASLANQTAVNYSLETQISSTEIVRLLTTNCGVQNPSWLELNNFARFFNCQLVDFERSPFCGPVAEQDLPGFRRFVLSCLLLMSKDFSSRSLNIADESGAPVTAQNDAQLIENFEVRRRWEHTAHPYLLFNQDGTTFTFVGFTVSPEGHLLNSATNAVVQNSIMSPQLYQSLSAQRVRLQERFEDLSRQNKIERMRMIFGYSDSDFPDPDPSYELTMDNVKKMIAIYMRFRSEIPVVLMGETGCGKTKLVEFLARIMLPLQSDVCNMRILKVHGAVTTADVVKAVKDAVELSRTNHDKTPYTILFFDEVNTTSAVGLIKEIMIDGRINGERISFAYGLRCIAACNPYRKHPETTIKRLENSGLGYRVRKEDTQDKFGNVPMRHLVYRVKPLPLSLISVLWDFGHLSDDSERKYIARMVESRLRTSPAGQRARLVELVAASQEFMRNTDEETKYVSLREVEKVIIVFQWLSNGILAQLDDQREDDEPDYSEETLIEIMTLASCYLSRLPKESKEGYLQLLARVLNAGLTPHDISRAITLCHQRLLNDISENLPKSIAKNEALRENVFMMVLCITLRIPLFVVGKPGSSKSLGKSIVKSNMLGTNSQGKIFRQLPNTQMLSFQCSPWSTSEGIIKTFEQCSQLQKEKDLDKFVSVVILDEVGLAEDSPKMPLKALHPLLEEGYFTDSLKESQDVKHRKVGFIGISNWALDPAKMNRGLHLLRDVPTHEDLLETAKGICHDQASRERVRKHLEHVTTFYEEIYKHTDREFFGLRDYFSLVKHLAGSPSLDQNAVTRCIKRNFSGFENLDPVEFFAKKIIGRGIDLGEYSAIRDALSSGGEDQRYLLLITENYSGFRILPQLLQNRQVTIIFGSSFPKDQEYSKICLDINRIKICMERGNTVVLLNMDALYESLYDVLNQYYEKCGQDRFVDLGLGTHRLKCKVSNDFRMIVVAEQATVRERFPIPLINRLEKHRLTTSAVLRPEQQVIVSRLSTWVQEFFPNDQKSKGRSPGSIFVGYHEDVIPSLLLEFDESDEDAVKRSILFVATPESLVRLDLTGLRDRKENYLNAHFDYFHQGSLKSFLTNYEFKKPFLQVTTFDRLLATRQIDELQKQFRGGIMSANLSKFESETQFIELVRRFFDTNEFSVLILQFEGLRLHYQNLLACAKYLIEDQFKEFSGRDPAASSQKRVILLIKLVRSHANAFTGFDSGKWHSVHIEELVPSGRVNIRLLDKMSISEAVKISHEAMTDGSLAVPMEVDHSLLPDRELSAPIHLRHLIEQSMHLAMSLLRDGRDTDTGETDGRLMERQEILYDWMQDDQHTECRQFFDCLCHFAVTVLTWRDETSVALYKPSEWLSREAARDSNVFDAGTFIESTWRILKQRVAPAIACFLAFADRDRNLNCFKHEALRGLWLRMVGPATALDQITEHLVKGTAGEFQRIEVASSSRDGRHFACRFPFSWAVVERLEQICRQERESVESLQTMFLTSTPIGEILSTVEASDELVSAFCHDLLRIRIAGVTEEMLAVLIPVMLRGLSRGAEASLGAAVFESFRLLKEFSQQLTLVTRLMQKVKGLVLPVDRIDRLSELPEALFDAFYEHLIRLCPELSNPERRLNWIGLVEQTQSVIESLLANFGNNNMSNMWHKVLCWFLFLKTVAAPFDADKSVQHDSFNPTGLWTSLVANPHVDFKDESGLRLIEIFLEGMHEELQNRLILTARCDKCDQQAQSLLTLPCKHHLCGDCLGKRILSRAAKRDCLIGVKRRCHCFFPSFFRMDRYNVREENCHTIIAVPGNGLGCVVATDAEELNAHELQQRAAEIQAQMEIDSPSRNCKLFIGVSDLPIACRRCLTDFFASEAVGSRMLVIEEFKSRCNAFLMQAILKLCFGYDRQAFCPLKRPPSSSLCRRLLSYVTKAGDDVGIVAWTTADDASPVFRSFVLQQLLVYNEREIFEQLDAHLRAANDVIRSSDILAVIVVNCIEDLGMSQLAEHPIDQRLVRALNQVVGTTAPRITPNQDEPLDFRQLRQVSHWRIGLSLLSSGIAGLPETAQSTDLPPMKDNTRRDRLKQALLDHQWSRVYFLRCLSHFGGTCATLKRLTTDEFLARVFREEMALIEGQVELPDILLSHSEVYRNVRRCLYQAYLTGELTQQRPEMREADNSVIALVTLIAAYRLRNMQGRCDQQHLNACIDLMVRWMTPGTQQLYTRLAPIAEATDGNHQLALLRIHLAFVLNTCQSDFVTFLTQLPNNFNNWLLPGMRHDELFEAFTAQGIGGTRAYMCPNGHPYYVANCGQPMVRARCPDCGSAIGGQNHTLVGGNADYQAADRTQRGFVPAANSNRPEPVRQLSAGGAALLRSLQSLAMLLLPMPGAFAEEFRAGLAMFSRATGRSQEDAALALHLLLLRCLPQPGPAAPFNLGTNDGRREFETRIEARLLRPLLDNLGTWLQEANRVVGQDDLGRTSEVVRLVQENSKLDREQRHEAQLWRFRQVISVEHAVQTFRELSAGDRTRHTLIEAVTHWEFALRHVRALPALVQLVKDLVNTWKLNLSKEAAQKRGLESCATNERWEQGIIEFKLAWNALRGHLSGKGARFPEDVTKGAQSPVAVFEIKSELFSEASINMPLAALLPHRGIWGRCIVGLVQLLMEAQNSVLEASGIQCDEVDICEADAASMVAYDPDADLLPALLANCAYSLRPGKGCRVTYNFDGLQQQLAELLVRGKLRLIGHLPQMLYKEEFNLMEQFQMLDKSVPQCRAPSSSAVAHALSSELPTSTPVITSLLEESLPTAISFLTSLAPQDRSQLLHDFMTKSLRMPRGLPEPLSRCVPIDHARLLWLALDRLRCHQLAEDSFEPFRDCRNFPSGSLDAQLKRLLPPDLRNRRSLLMEKLHCLIRLELASRPDLLDMPLAGLADLFPDYDGVFDNWNDRLLCKHAAAIWMEAFAMDGTRGT